MVNFLKNLQSGSNSATTTRLKNIGLTALVSFLITACGSLDEPVDRKIESVGSRLTGVPVRVDNVELRLARGLGEIRGLTVANPEGYTTDSAFRMDLIRLNLGVLSALAGDVLVLEELVIDSPAVTFERSPKGGSNWREIAQNVRANRESADRQSAEEAPVAGETPEKPLRLTVHRLLIRGVTFKMRRADGASASGTLRTIELTDVGGAEGTTAGGLGQAVVLTMAREIFKQAAGPRLQDRVKGVRLVLEGLEPERILAMLKQRLTLAAEQWERVKSVIEEQIRTLREAIDEVRTQGLLEFEPLRKRFAAAAEQARMRLEGVLSKEQLQKLREVFDELQQRTTEEIRNALADEIGQQLKLSLDQMERARPVLRDEIQKLSDLLHRLANAYEMSREGFVKELEALQEGTRRKLAQVVNPDQLEALARRQEQLRKLIQEAYFGIVEP